MRKKIEFSLVRVGVCQKEGQCHQQIQGHVARIIRDHRMPVLEFSVVVFMIHSTTNRKSIEDWRYPCHTPVSTANGSDSSPLWIFLILEL